MLKEVYEKQLEEGNHVYEGGLLSRSDQADFVPPQPAEGEVRLASEGDVMGKAMSLPFKFPKLFIPLIVMAVFQSTLVHYLRTTPSLQVDYLQDQGVVSTIVLVLLILFAISFSVVTTGSVVLEMMQQWKTLRKMSYFRALLHSLTTNIVATVQVALTLSIQVFIVSVIAAVLKGNQRGSTRERLVQGGEHIVKDYMVMRAFLMLPAIAWEDLSFRDAGERVDIALRVIGGSFNAGFAMYNIVLLLLELPVLAIFYLGSHNLLPLPNVFLVATLIYMLLIPLYTMSIQVIYAASLYNWYLQYLAAREKLQPEVARDLQLSDVPIVHLLEEAPTASKL